jgi:CRP/FNR family transcriptional regulator, anaerobic regulatory protein
MKKLSCISCPTSSCFIRRFCTEDWMGKTDEKRVGIAYAKDQLIVHEGTAVSGIHLVAHGKVKIFFSGLNGKRQIVRFAKDGHLIGHKGIAKYDYYPFSAAAMENSFTCFLDNEFLQALFESNPALVIGLMQYYSRELRRAEERIKNLSQMNVREKIADVLLMLYDNFGVNAENELQVLFSRNDIANTAGTSAAQVAVHLGELENEQIIKRRGNKIIELCNIRLLKNLVSQHNPHKIFA